MKTNVVECGWNWILEEGWKKKKRGFLNFFLSVSKMFVFLQPIWMASEMIVMLFLSWNSVSYENWKQLSHGKEK